MSVRKITIKSGNEEFTLDVTEEEYRNYFRPWWQQKKHEQKLYQSGHAIWCERTANQLMVSLLLDYSASNCRGLI